MVIKHNIPYYVMVSICAIIPTIPIWQFWSCPRPVIRSAVLCLPCKSINRQVCSVLISTTHSAASDWCVLCHTGDWRGGGDHPSHTVKRPAATRQPGDSRHLPTETTTPSSVMILVHSGIALHTVLMQPWPPTHLDHRYESPAYQIKHCQE